MPVTSLSYVTVTGNFKNPDGTAADGLVEFYTDVQLVNVTTNQIVVPGTYRAQLVSGAFSISIPATDDADFSPTGWTWRVRELVEDAIREYSISLPASPSTVDLADVVPVATATQVSQYVLKSLYDANTILIATVDDTPIPLTVPASTIVARLAAGGIIAATPAQLPFTWTAYTPVLTQSGVVTKTVDAARYMQIGKLVFAQVRLTATGAGTANNRVTVSLPVTALAAVLNIGSGELYDLSATTAYTGVVGMETTTTVSLVIGPATNAAPAGVTGSPFSAALAAGDIILLSMFYEAA